MDWWGSPEAEELFNLVDPFSYKNRYEIPKYIINAAGDEFFIPTSSQFYYDELPGEKHLRYVPNVGHGLNGTYILEPLFSFYLSIINNQPRPSYKWEFLSDGQIKFESEAAPDDVKIWWADNENARDFRVDEIGKTWQAKAIIPRSDGSYVRDWVYVDDVVDAYIKVGKSILEKPTDNYSYNFSSQDNFSVMYVYEKLCNMIHGKYIDPIFEISSEKEIPSQFLDSSLIKNDLNIEAKVKLEEGLKKTINWYKEYLKL